jgi:hypothetical protein
MGPGSRDAAHRLAGMTAEIYSFTAPVIADT